MTDDEIIEDYRQFRIARHYCATTKKRWFAATPEEKRKILDAAALAKKYGKQWGVFGKRTFNGRRCMHEDIKSHPDGVSCIRCGAFFRDSSNNTLEIERRSAADER
jgi:hypothetical protein